MMTNLKKPFSEMEVGAQFYFERERFKKTGERIAWSVYNNALRKEWVFQGDEEVTVNDFVEMVPLLTEESLHFLAEKIKAVIDGQYVEHGDIINTSYTWDKTPLGATEGLEPIMEIHTYHGFGYHGCFKPSVAEVLACIPGNLVEQVVAFEIIGGPETATDLNKQMEYVNAGFHQALTRLYKKS